jgi:ankyrin repeat protein
MSRQYVVCTILALCALIEGLPAQVPAKIDFERDVLPIFRQNCVSCHGPSQQMNGLRLDRKSSVLSIRRVVPGGIENSFLYKRMLGSSEYGPQMPPSGSLRPEQVEIIKKWIEQGAEWPDSLANEVNLPPLNPKAVAMVEALRSGDRQDFMSRVAADPKLLNERGPEGSTPFMYAVLYSDPATLERLLKQGADPNKHNDANATALMWAAVDLEKTRVLLDHGAQLNVRSDDFRTPLMIAATRQGNAPVIKLLLDRGANPNPNPKPEMGSPLIQAGTAGDAEMMQLLIAKGAEVKAAAEPLLVSAITNRCEKCLDLVVAKNPGREAFSGALIETAALADVNTIRLLLDHGADVNAFDPFGRSPLMYAAVSDLLSLDVVKLLIDRGADMNAKNRHTLAGDANLTVLDIAKLHGNTPIVDLLVEAGAKSTPQAAPTLKPLRTNNIQAAIQRSVPLLQRADADFTQKAGCVSCHNDSLPAMATGLARRSGFRVDEEIARKQVRTNVSFLERFRDRLHQGVFVAQVNDTFGSDILGYILIGLDAERYKPDLNTDAVAMYMKMHQMTDGHWEIGRGDQRPPLCSLYIGQTVLAMRALQLYAPKTDRAAYEKSVQMAAAWIAKAEPVTSEDRVWRVIGLAWAGKDKDATRKAMRELLAIQQGDGGWSDMQSMSSTAYATGRALVALQTAGLLVSDPAYQRGVQFLLNTQQEDGSWYVKTRALGFQPYFDNGFPHAYDQWISAAGTSWATMALTLASQGSTTASTAVARVR